MWTLEIGYVRASGENRVVMTYSAMPCLASICLRSRPKIARFGSVVVCPSPTSKRRG